MSFAGAIEGGDGVFGPRSDLKLNILKITPGAIYGVFGPRSDLKFIYVQVIPGRYKGGFRPQGRPNIVHFFRSSLGRYMGVFGPRNDLNLYTFSGHSRGDIRGVSSAPGMT